MDRKKNTKVIHVRMCPRCKSINIKSEPPMGLTGLTAVGIPFMNRCLDCGFRGYFFPEVAVEIHKKNIKNKLKNDRTKTRIS